MFLILRKHSTCSVPHSQLIIKLTDVGLMISPYIVQWVYITNFLITNSLLVVVVNSRPRCLFCPEFHKGQHLPLAINFGPLDFLIYINDLIYHKCKLPS